MVVCQVPYLSQVPGGLGNLTSHHQLLGGHPHWGLWGEPARRAAFQAWQVDYLILMSLNSLLLMATGLIKQCNDWILRRFQDKEFVSSVLEQVRITFTFLAKGSKGKDYEYIPWHRRSLLILSLVRWTRRAWGSSSRSWAVSHTLLLAGETSEWE